MKLAACADDPKYNEQQQEIWAALANEKLDDIRAIRASTTAAGIAAPLAETFTADDAWHELVEKDDRNSPEEYPEMCLITIEELRDFMQRSSHVGALDPSDEIYYEGYEQARADLGAAPPAASADAVREDILSDIKAELIRRGITTKDQSVVYASITEVMHAVKCALCAAPVAAMRERAALREIAGWTNPEGGYGKAAAIAREVLSPDAGLGVVSREDLRGEISDMICRKMRCDCEGDENGADPSKAKCYCLADAILALLQRQIHDGEKEDV